MTNARQVAYRCLQRIDHEGAYANLLLQSELGRSRLSERDRGFVTELVYGTTRMRRACDALIDRFLTREPQPSLRTLLRLGAYQLHFAGVAAHAAVGETVELAPKAARGFVNAILRRVGDTPMIWPNDAVRLSYPDWIFERMRTELGAEAEPALSRMNEPAPVSVRDDGYRQDLASQWVAAAVEAAPGEQILDMCAAPGGKATAMSSTGADVIAADLQLHRARLIREVPVVVGDACRATVCRFDLRQGPGRRALQRARCLAPACRCPVADHANRRVRVGRVAAADPRRSSALGPTRRMVGVQRVHPDRRRSRSTTRFPIGSSRSTMRRGRSGGVYGHGWRVLPHDHDTDGMVLIRYRRAP